MLSWRLGFRSLLRHKRRSIITALGIALSLAMMIFFVGISENSHSQMADMGIRLGAGHVIIQGKGYDIHDGKRIDYEAGDVIIVENGCVHQHFNASDEEDLISLVMKAKPLFLFMHMVFQKTVAYPSDTLPKGHEDFTPPSNI